MLAILTESRRNCRICVERDPGLIQNGSSFDFDPSVVSYWSQWLGDTSPKMLIVGQDFGDAGYFARWRGVDEPNNTTNNNLRLLLAEAGVTVGQPPHRDDKAGVFLTNSILCLKSGAMSAPIKETWVKACAKHHLSALITYLKPKVVIGMGNPGWLAVRTALNIRQSPPRIGEAAGRFWPDPTTQVFAVGHCSGLGLRNRPWQQQVVDWRKLGLALTEFADN